MLTYFGQDGTGNPVLLVGLTGENVTRLVADEPILIDVVARARAARTRARVPNLQVVVVYGRNDTAVLERVEEFRQATEPARPGRSVLLLGREKPTPLLVVDLDGTVRHGLDELGRFVNTADDVVMFPEAVALIAAWKRAGGRVVAVSNQGGVALGHLSAEDCAAAMARTNELAGGLFDKIAWCQHHPDADDPEMARCWCRKPSPGLLVEAAAELAVQYGEIYPPHLGLFVGDRLEDAECAKLAGFTFMWAAEWRATAADCTAAATPPAVAE